MTKAPKYYRQQTDVLLFLARFGQASTPEIPHSETDTNGIQSDLITDMEADGWVQETMGACPNTGGMRPVWWLTTVGKTQAVKRGYKPHPLNPTSLIGRYFAAPGLGFGRVMTGQGGYLQIDVYTLGRLDEDPVRQVVALPDTVGWHFYATGDNAHHHALLTRAAELRAIKRTGATA